MFMVHRFVALAVIRQLGAYTTRWPMPEMSQRQKDIVRQKYITAAEVFCDVLVECNSSDLLEHVFKHTADLSVHVLGANFAEQDVLLATPPSWFISEYKARKLQPYRVASRVVGLARAGGKKAKYSDIVLPYGFIVPVWEFKKEALCSTGSSKP
jgi:hypothetical protein